MCERSLALSPSCVGLDPIPALMRQLDFFDGRSDESVYESLMLFGEVVVSSVADVVAVVKPQSAHYEVWGLAGMRALHDTIVVARRAGIPVLLDAKRGDIGSTAASYAEAYLRSGTGIRGSFEVDALTVNPYLGRETVEPFAREVSDGAHGIFVCTRTSNPGATDIQEAQVEVNGERVSVSQVVAGWLTSFTAGLPVSAFGEYGYGPMGAVMGATYPEEAQRLRDELAASIFLVPGMGAQGGSAAALRPFFDQAGLGAVVSSSRAVTFQGVNSRNRSEYTASVRNNAAEFSSAVRAASLSR
ncbi:MAG: orotidine-5'-phosphate decarboxylase [Rhodoglobus sp.]